MGSSQAKFQHMIVQCCFKETLHYVWQIFIHSNFWISIKFDDAIVQLYMKYQPFIKNIIEDEISEVNGHLGMPIWFESS